MKVTLNGLDYAIRFTRDGDKKTYCDIKVGGVGQSPKEMTFHVVGSAQRMSIDQFDKVEGYKLALERAMKALNLKRWEQRADSLALKKEDRVKIWAAFRKWVEDNKIKTKFDITRLPAA
jgi:hypothetical protein